MKWYRAMKLSAVPDSNCEEVIRNYRNSCQYRPTVDNLIANFTEYITIDEHVVQCKNVINHGITIYICRMSHVLTTVMYKHNEVADEEIIL